MITDEQLREAALELDQAILTALPEHGGQEFSPRFERRMKWLFFKAKHPYVTKAAFKAAAFLVIFLLGSAVMLAVPNASASFSGLYYEVTGNRYRYVLNGVVSAEDIRAYHPAWVPEGYHVLWSSFQDAHGTISYRSEAKKMISFHYFIQGEGEEGALIYRSFQEGHILSDTIVNGRGADLFIMTLSDGSVSYTVVWMNEDRSILFSIGGARSEEEAVRMAESVRPDRE